MPTKRRAVLFGKTGDGKSTIANALVTGGIERQLFRSSDSARGCTTRIQKETGRGWTVTDTVGLGEAQTGAVPNAAAKEMLTTFLMDVKDRYSHIIYVIKKRRLTTVDEMIWLLFSSIFEGAEEAFVVVITCTDEKWLRDNWDSFPPYLKKLRIVVTDIPPISHRKPSYEAWQKPRREKSIKKLEEDLLAIFRKRDLQFATPGIATMKDSELEEKSEHILRIVVDFIKKSWEETSWKKIAAKLATLAPIAELIVTVVIVTAVIL